MMTKPKVLIVDDDVAITQQLFWTLCDEFEVMTANNLSSAIRRATIGSPSSSRRRGFFIRSAPPRAPECSLTSIFGPRLPQFEWPCYDRALRQPFCLVRSSKPPFPNRLPESRGLYFFSAEARG